MLSTETSLPILYTQQTFHSKKPNGRNRYQSHLSRPDQHEARRPEDPGKFAKDVGEIRSLLEHSPEIEGETENFKFFCLAEYGLNTDSEHSWSLMIESLPERSGTTTRRRPRHLRDFSPVSASVFTVEWSDSQSISTMMNDPAEVSDEQLMHRVLTVVRSNCRTLRPEFPMVGDRTLHHSLKLTLFQSLKGHAISIERKMFGSKRVEYRPKNRQRGSNQAWQDEPHSIMTETFVNLDDSDVFERYMHELCVRVDREHGTLCGTWGAMDLTCRIQQVDDSEVAVLLTTIASIRPLNEVSTHSTASLSDNGFVSRREVSDWKSKRTTFCTK